MSGIYEALYPIYRPSSIVGATDDGVSGHLPSEAIKLMQRIEAEPRKL